MPNHLLNPEQHRILISKPLFRMQQFAALLYWRSLRLERIIFDEQTAASNPTIPESCILCYYMTPDYKFNLQINELNTDPITYQATVKAERYGIVYTDWTPFTLFEDNQQLLAEAKRVSPVLNRNNFKNKQWRERTMREHSERLLPRIKERVFRKWTKRGFEIE